MIVSCPAEEDGALATSELFDRILLFINVVEVSPCVFTIVVFGVIASNIAVVVVLGPACSSCSTFSVSGYDLIDSHFSSNLLSFNLLSFNVSDNKVFLLAKLDKIPANVFRLFDF
ncbi:hypothetical protein BDF21DRAFT_420923 [Thamnidium elegans]|nr:hypothetical protein BDF21DRAFT_420923 [Thamnidium elegans]